jgi:hypothetical protein
MAILYLNDIDFFVIDDPESVIGYLGVFVHEGNVRVLSAKYEEIDEPEETEPVETEKPAETQSPEPSQKEEEKDERKENNSIIYIVIGVGVVLVTLAVVFVVIKRRKG